ncbi:MAG: ImmA/IrrE family metallo-endopeptidase [Sphingomonadaceae bacterium]|nr:ImmA/IrrE family metallo-endopeptidase [Sphingomonadaceae bacterium]
MSGIQDAARERAREVLTDYGSLKSPVAVEKIIKRRDIRVQFSPLDQELSGMALVKDGVAVIGVNALHHPNRQRFTMAHELGHHVMHREYIEGAVHVDKGFTILRRDTLAAQGTDRMEIEANAFASELLIPRDLLEPIIGTGDFDLDDVDRLQSIAKKFKVSLSALQYRLLAFT